MATTTAKKKTTFKETVNNARTGVSEWNKAIKKAYSVGFDAGYNAHKSIPDKFGTRVVATNGFKKGFKNAQQAKKYTSK